MKAKKQKKVYCHKRQGVKGTGKGQPKNGNQTVCLSSHTGASARIGPALNIPPHLHSSNPINWADKARRAANSRRQTGSAKARNGMMWATDARGVMMWGCAGGGVITRA